jgi:hypothetical protein
MKQKIKFIEKQTKLPKELSKLFNIVVNYNQLNSPKKVGMCTKIYDKIFKDNPNITFEDAVKKYYQEITKLGNGLGMLIIENHQQQTYTYSKKLLTEIEMLEDKDNNKYKEIINFLKNKGSEDITREEQYKSMLYKTLAIFKKNQEPEELINEIINWKNKIKKYEDKEFREMAKKYLFDLLTINSMIGILIQNDILKTLACEFEDVYGTNDKFEKMEIDGFINGKRASIKSINYKNSPYKKVAAQNIEEIIKGPIIYYKIHNDEYKIENMEEIKKHYKNYGTEDKILKEIEEVKYLKIECKSN